MTRNLLILAALLSAAAAYTWYDDGAQQRMSEKIAAPAIQTAQQKAPDFSFETLTGKKTNLSDFENKPVILNFWASWCAPCVIEFPQMLTLAKNNPGAVFIFLSLDDDEAAMNRFLKKLGPDTKLKNVHIGRDEDKEISQGLYQTFKLPETYLIDSNHDIAEKIIGNSEDWSGPAIQQKITDLTLPR